MNISRNNTIYQSSLIARQIQHPSQRIRLFIFSVNSYLKECLILGFREITLDALAKTHVSISPCVDACIYLISSNMRINVNTNSAIYLALQDISNISDATAFQ